MKGKISKKHLFIILLICSLVGNVCLYMGKYRAEQKVSGIAKELREEQGVLTTNSNEKTEKEEPEAESDELSLAAETNLPDIEQEIDEYRMHFTELYTSNAMEEIEFCSIEDLGEMDYYLFCHTEMSADVGPVEYVSIVISSQTRTIKEAEDLYQEFVKRLPLEDDTRQYGL